MWHLINVFTYVWNGQIPTSWRLRFQSASSFHFAASAVKYLPWQQPRPTARFQMPPASYQQQLPQPFCLFLFVCNFEVWRFLSSNKRHRTNCRSSSNVWHWNEFGHSTFEAPDFGKLPASDRSYKGRIGRIKLEDFNGFFCTWSIGLGIVAFQTDGLNDHQLVGIYIFLRMPGRAEILIWLKWMFACTHCTFERALQRHLRCKSVLQCKFPSWSAWKAAIKQWMWMCDLHQGLSMSGFIFELLAFVLPEK